MMESILNVSQVDGIFKITTKVEYFDQLAAFMTNKFGYNWMDLFFLDEELEDEGIMHYESKPAHLDLDKIIYNF